MPDPKLTGEPLTPEMIVRQCLYSVSINVAPDGTRLSDEWTCRVPEGPLLKVLAELDATRAALRRAEQERDERCSRLLLDAARAEVAKLREALHGRMVGKNRLTGGYSCECTNHGDPEWFEGQPEIHAADCIAIPAPSSAGGNDAPVS